MAKENKLVKLLKENWIGGGIGLILSFTQIFKTTIGNLLYNTTSRLWNNEGGAMGFALIGTLLLPLIGYILGAFIQSKLKK